MSSHIDKDDIKRWFYAQDSNSGEVSLIIFGYGGEFLVSEVISGQTTLISFLTEEELGMYLRLIFYAWTHNAELPKNKDIL